MSLSMALVGETVAKEKTGTAMGILGTTSAVGTALGPSAGGLVMATFGWRAGFFAMVPLVVVALLLAVRYLPTRPGQAAASARAGSFDIAGTLVLAVTLGAYALALT